MAGTEPLLFDHSLTLEALRIASSAVLPVRDQHSFLPVPAVPLDQISLARWFTASTTRSPLDFQTRWADSLLAMIWSSAPLSLHQLVVRFTM